MKRVKHTTSVPLYRRPLFVVTSSSLLVVGAVLAIVFINRADAPVASAPQPAPAASEPTVPVPPQVALPQPEPVKPSAVLHEPIAQFAQRITKKKFGTYITPQNSPVQPERFSGYHTAVDVEYQDVVADVPVYAIADGEITYAGNVSGYGGVTVLRVTIDGTSRLALYGHLRPSALPRAGQKFTRGQQMSLLGTGYSSETDGERRHLHFGIIKGSQLNVRGYVSSQAALASWLDPLSLDF